MIVTRQATLADCEFVASLFDNEEYQLWFAENDTPVELWRERFVTYGNEGKHNLIIMDTLRRNSSGIGWLLYELDGDVCKLDIIVMRRDLVGTGLGYYAFGVFLSLLPDNVKKVVLDVQQRNEHAVNFYKRYGFAIVSEEMQPVGDGEQPYYNMEYLLRPDREALAKQYLQCWLTREAGMLDKLFAKDAVCVEATGSEYHGIAKIQRWFADWQKNGKVLEWTAKRAVSQGEYVALEWSFRWEWDGQAQACEGMTLFRFDAQDKIAEVREFAAKTEHTLVYGE